MASEPRGAARRTRVARRVASRHSRLARSVVRVGHDVATARRPKVLPAVTRLAAPGGSGTSAPYRPAMASALRASGIWTTTVQPRR